MSTYEIIFLFNSHFGVNEKSEKKTKFEAEISIKKCGDSFDIVSSMPDRLIYVEKCLKYVVL